MAHVSLELLADDGRELKFPESWKDKKFANRECINPPFRTDLINAAMGAQRLSNAAVAKKAGVGSMTVSKSAMAIHRLGYMTLKKVVEALGLTVAEVSQKKAD